MSPGRLTVTLLIIMTFCQGPAFSQTASVSVEGARRISMERSEVGLADVLPAFLDGVAIEAGQANGKATINFTQELGNQSLIATLSAPVDESADPTDFASLDGLASDLSFSLSFSGFHLPKLDKRVLSDQRKVCASYNVAKGECDQEGLMRAVALTCKFDVKSVEQKEVPAQLKLLRQTADKTQRTCLDVHRRRALDDFDLASFGGKTIFSWTLAGELGRKQATFFEADGSKGKDTNLPYALSAALGWTGRSSRTSLRGRYEMRFKDGKNVTRCEPLSGSSGLQTCEDLPFGKPSGSEAFVVNAESRWFFDHWAASPVGSYDFKEKVLGLQLPVYFLRNSDGQLTGGFRLGWRDDTHDLTASVFISKPLTLGE